MFVIAYLVTHPEKTEVIAGWFYRGYARIRHAADKKAVAYSVQGDVNSARKEFMKNGPENLMEGTLRVKWADPEEAEAQIREEGDVIVFMRRSRHQAENVANAVMAYLPRAVIPRARRYVGPKTMRAVDLTLARAILQVSHMPKGALDAFFESHLDPALAENPDLKTELEEVDSIDLHGWLTRVMLAEYRILGDRLHPGPCDESCLRDAREFCRWLGRLAAAPSGRPGGQTRSLIYRGRYLKVAVGFVAIRGRIESEGLGLYRKLTKKRLYEDRVDAVYLMARDENMEAVRKLRDSLAGDALIESVTTYEYALRADFKVRRIARDHAICVVLRRRDVSAADAPAPDEDVTDETLQDDVEVYEVEFGAFVPDGQDSSTGSADADEPDTSPSTH